MRRVLVPLTATIDYFGFRVLAVCKLPSEKVLFSPDGDVRRVTEELVHGLQSNGDFFINRSKDLQVLLEGASRQLNLAKHHCHGVKDKSIKLESTFISAETTVYKDEGGGTEESFGGKKDGDSYYMRDFWRFYPPEIPDETPHLTRSPRDQSVFWRLLRPELVVNFRTALNPDGGCMLSQRCPGETKWTPPSILFPVFFPSLPLLFSSPFFLDYCLSPIIIFSPFSFLFSPSNISHFFLFSFIIFLISTIVSISHSVLLFPDSSPPLSPLSPLSLQIATSTLQTSARPLEPFLKNLFPR